jgi:hypothetical protein
MPDRSHYDVHQRAAEFHDLAAHAHRAAAAHLDKEDHLTGHELSKQAMEHSSNAFQQSQEALRISALLSKQRAAQGSTREPQNKTKTKSKKK